MGELIQIESLNLRSEVVRVARKNIGYGEVEGNNDGPLLRAIGGKPGHEWCALFAGYCYRKAITNLWGVTMRDEWAWRKPGQPVIGAKELVKAAWGAGALRFTDPLFAKPGDLICWHRRTGPISWKGHVGLVEEIKDGLVHTIEGNVGKFPSRVKRLVRDVHKDDRFYGFAGFR
jgi:hypothetical protein